MEVQFFYWIGVGRAPCFFKSATSHVGVMYNSKLVGNKVRFLE